VDEAAGAEQGFAGAVVDLGQSSVGEGGGDTLAAVLAIEALEQLCLDDEAGVAPVAREGGAVGPALAEGLGDEAEGVPQGEAEPEVVILVGGQGRVEAAGVEDVLSASGDAGGVNEDAGKEGFEDVVGVGALAVAVDGGAVAINTHEVAIGEGQFGPAGPAGALSCLAFLTAASMSAMALRSRWALPSASLIC